ncbi:MAG TPA: adenine deaminase C-terminal domain-containing protein [Candidatus Acidoferrum sp.]|nr:adenine deaminase C-terminal domain-containing protein [Candidatus Acidoferrum sp.]
MGTTQEKHSFGSEIRIRQELVAVALEVEAADLVMEHATLLNVHSLTWKNDWDIVIKGQRIAWVGPHGDWKGSASCKVSVQGLWAVPGFGEAHKHIESTMLSPEYEADLVLRFGTTWNVEASHEFSNVNGERNVEFWLLPRQRGSPFKIFPSLGSATPPTGWEESGGYYGYSEIRNFIDRNLWVTGLDEVMDWSAVVNPKNPGYKRLWENIEATLEARGVVEGHGNGLVSLAEISAFAASGISSDHEVCQGQEAWDKLERGIFLETRPDSRHVLKFLLERGLRDWSNVSVTTDDRNAETTLRRGAMDHNIRCAIENGVPVEIAYSLGGYNTARHFRIDHVVGSLTPGRYADVVLLSDPERVKIKAVYSDGIKVSEDGKMLVPVPKIDWPKWATKTVNLGRKIEPSDFAVPAPTGRTTVYAAVVPPFHHQKDFFTVELSVENGLVQRDEMRAITKVALLDRYSGRTRISRMFWKDVGMKTPDSAMCCSIVHDNHNAWVIGSSDEAMALAVNTMAEMDGGFVLVSHGKVVAKVRLEIGGLMTARPAEELAHDLLAMRAEMDKLEWMEKSVPAIQDFLGVEHVTEALCYAFLTCPPWHWTFMPPSEALPEGFVNIRTGETHPVIW